MKMTKKMKIERKIPWLRKSKKMAIEKEEIEIGEAYGLSKLGEAWLKA